ncbi:MAG: NADH-quinone oxidoreductase subunit N [Acidimicrobiia bacterium]|nr:NADH-quinone oxidoreductase subunit N [Acidimicrobiia bacterium]
MIAAGLSNLGVLAQIAEFTPLDTPEVQWAALLPLLILAGGGVVLLTVSSLVKAMAAPGVNAAATVLVGLASIIACVPVWQRVQDPERGPFTAVGGVIGIDGFSILATGLIAASVILAALLLDDYLRREDIDGVEMYALLLLSASGGVIMASANDLIVMFLGLEALSIAIYVMAAMHRRRIESQEAGFKYFIVGAFSSAFFLYGIAMVYGATGSTNLVEIATFLANNLLLRNGVLMLGMALLLVGFGFKVSAVPFQGWTPDVYQGAPTPVTAFMASAVKVAAFAGLIRVFYLALGTYSLDWKPAIYALAVLSMIIGATFAVVQTDVKRMMAYSSISHAGFVLVAVQAGTEKGVTAAIFYLTSYVFMVAGSFGVISLVGRRGDAAHSLDDYRGLSRSRPGLALAFTVFLLAQAGVPLTSGFVAKFNVIAAAVDARSFWLALIAMLASVIAAVLYLKIIVAMYLTGDDAEADDSVAGPKVSIPLPAAAAIGIAIVATLAIGVLPGYLFEVAGDAVPVLIALP